LSRQNAEFGFGQIEPTAVPKRGIATKEPWACNAVRSSRPAVSLRRRGALLWILRLSWTNTTVLARGKWTSAKSFKTCAYSMAVPLFAAQNRLEPFFHQLPAHVVEHGGAGVQGLPDLLSLHPARRCSICVQFSPVPCARPSCSCRHQCRAPVD